MPPILNPNVQEAYRPGTLPTQISQPSCAAVLRGAGLGFRFLICVCTCACECEGVRALGCGVTETGPGGLRRRRSRPCPPPRSVSACPHSHTFIVLNQQYISRGGRDTEGPVTCWPAQHHKPHDLHQQHIARGGRDMEDAPPPAQRVGLPTHSQRQKSHVTFPSTPRLESMIHRPTYHPV